MLVNCTAKWRNDELHEKLKLLADTSIKIVEASVDDSPAILDVNFKVKSGEMVAIVGRVGCGKSSLLNTIMSQIYIQKGRS